MTILDVLTVPNPVLSQKCDPVTVFDKELQQLIDDMFETMNDSKGIGLAAPQVGVLMQLFICKTETDRVVAINPKLEYLGDELESEEGCLSIPNILAVVDRRSQVKLTAKDVNGKEFSRVYDDLMAIVIQHEFDHLVGKLITDCPLEIKNVEGDI
ncbi:peptide deformylase [Candidatus Marinamargulisbacteria bacterium SCGC AG-343-D04]|nr:peptide deformylase [Candidatus Marinamargulisbacteria bacterium SCGC AG-343-D04]